MSECVCVCVVKATLLDTVNFASTHNPSVAL